MKYSKFTTEAEQKALNEKYAGVIFEQDGKKIYKANNFYGSKMDIERYNWIKDNIFNGVEFLDPSTGPFSL